MTLNRPTTRGAELEQRLRRGIQMARRAIQPGARELEALTGVTQQCSFLEPQENVLAKFGTILVSSGRIYRYGNDIVMELIDGDKRSIVNLSTGRTMESNAVAHLSNIVTCEITNPQNGRTSQFPPPRELVRIILSHEPTLQRLPVIKTYANRPLFDENYQLCGPGWHAEAGYLIHGDDIDPVLPEQPTDTGSIASRLPPLLRELLTDFCFRSDADRVNAVGAMLTALLVNQFISTGKPVFAMDGNQPSVGKTLFANVLGVLCDGKEPSPIRYTQNDEELEKKICATLRTRRSSILLFDNAKLSNNAVMESATIEANCTAALISLRILGCSLNHEQPNDVLWLFTMNNTRLGPDLTARNCPIRFHFDGDPNGRHLTCPDLIDFARTHRTELIAELAGMVLYWRQQGQRPGTQTHRLSDWATTIGGILDANHLYGFLANSDEANAEFNTESDDLTALAEHAVQQYQQGDQNLVRIVTDIDAQDSSCQCGLLAGELLGLFRSAGVLQDKLGENKSERSRACTIAAYLSKFLHRRVEISVRSPHGDTRPLRGVATLESRGGRSREKRYYFDLRLSPDDDDPPEAGGVTNPQDPPNPSPPPVPFQLPTQSPVPATICVGAGNDMLW